jgi:large subunit ribosomal protein L19e
MMLKLQKRLAASILHCSPKRVIFDPTRLEDIKEAITKTDIRLLVGEGTITGRPQKGVSRGRANKLKTQKSKGLRKGAGSKKGKATARRPGKQAWMDGIRAQRKFLKYLRNNALIKHDAFKELYSKSKGGYFRSIKHIKLYITEHDLLLAQGKGAKTSLEKIKSKERVDEKKNAAKEKGVLRT